MNKQQWRNLWHSFRYMRRYAGEREAMDWIAFYSRGEAMILLRVVV